MHSGSLNELFERNILYSLLKFRLEAKMDGPHVLRYIQSMLSSKCIYSFHVEWPIDTQVSRFITSKILQDTFEQLKRSIPFQFELVLYDNSYTATASTVPRKSICLSVSDYLDGNHVHRYEYRDLYLFIVFFLNLDKVDGH